jgi:hypothetical protein
MDNSEGDGAVVLAFPATAATPVLVDSRQTLRPAGQDELPPEQSFDTPGRIDWPLANPSVGWTSTRGWHDLG